MSSIHTKCGILISLTVCMRGCISGPIQATQWQPRATEECNSLRGVSALWDNIEQIGIQTGFASGLNSKDAGWSLLKAGILRGLLPTTFYIESFGTVD